MTIKTIGLDLAKQVFQIHAVDERGQVVMKKQLARAKLAAFFANLPPCLVGMEACSSAHFWANKLARFGHDVRLMAPQFVKPYVKGSKTDHADAEAICEAVQRPSMRFVPIKQPEQQALLALHRARQGFVKARTAQGNQLRGLLAEFGIIIPQGISKLFQQLPILMEDAEHGLPDMMRELVCRLAAHLRLLDSQAKELEQRIEQWHRQSESSRRLAAIPGIGPITATALVASVGNAHAFENGRQLAAWLGLVPRQHSSGGKPVLLGISKRGDVYLRTLLIHGARAVIAHAERRIQDGTNWLSRLLSRRNRNVAAVALANKNARIAWSLLTSGCDFESGHLSFPAVA